MNLRFTANLRIIHGAKTRRRKDSCTHLRTRLASIYREGAKSRSPRAPQSGSPASAIAGERLDTAIACFLAERDLAPSTHRVYALALARLQEQLGADTPVSQITARRLAQFMGSSYQHLAPASWNRVVATLGSFFAYTTRQGWTRKSPCGRPGATTLANQP